MSPSLSTCAPVDAIRTIRFLLRNLSRGVVSDTQTISRACVVRTIQGGDGANLQTCFRSDSSWVVVEEGDQAVVTTMALHVEVPLRRYPWGRPESKYIESPDSSACSWPSMCTFNLPLSV